MKRGALVVALVLLSSCGSRVRNWDEQLAAQGQPAVTAPRATTSTTSRTQGGADVTAARRTATTKPGGAPGPTTAVRSALPHPAPGRYTYDVEYHVPAFEGEPATDEKDLYAVTWSVSGGDDALTLTESGDDGTTTTYAVTTGAFELRSIKYDDDGDVYRCDYSPPALVLKLPVTVGAKWSTASTCTYDDGEVDHITREAAVTGTAKDTIGGAKVDTVVLRWTETTTETYPDDPDDEPYTYKELHTAHIDPKTLLIVSEDLVDQSEDSFGATSKRTLKSMTPG